MAESRAIFLTLPALCYHTTTVSHRHSWIFASATLVRFPLRDAIFFERGSHESSVHVKALNEAKLFICATLAAAALLLSTSARAQDTPCVFDYASLAYAGIPQEQARCLLRPVLIGGHLGATLKRLPPPLDKLLGGSLKVDKDALRRYLKEHNINEADIGGSLSDPVARANTLDPNAPLARYFVIHDVSTPNYLDKPFPPDINEAMWPLNDLKKRWANRRVTHVYINRLGESVTAVDFGTELPDPNHGTKFARDRLRNRGKGLYLHVELVQPRRSDPQGRPGNDSIAPLPGFTDAQLERLALCYIAASVRRGLWLIPAFHAAIDVGIADAHDDPQNFDLVRWANHLDKLLKEIKKNRKHGQ
ncbi:MAG: hypothetical protein M3362_05695 [Acidobacteriota bacterium]|nr:hypothetical protein [Acidobacteriota bacterium]